MPQPPGPGRAPRPCSSALALWTPAALLLGLAACGLPASPPALAGPIGQPEALAAPSAGGPAPAPGAASAAATTAAGAAEDPDCLRLPPLPQPPASALDVTRFGARPDDDRADDEAVERALAAARDGDWLVFPPGRYLQARSWYVTTPRVTLWAAGATIHALDHRDLTIGLRADGVRLYGATLTAAPGQRRLDIPGTRVSIAPGRAARTEDPPVRGNVVRGVRILPPPDSAPRLLVGATSPRGGASAGIFAIRAADFTIAENQVVETLADGIHVTGGAFNGRILANRVEGSGDDAIATVSYLGPRGMELLRSGARPTFEDQVRDVLIQDNRVGFNPWGRGIGVIGSRRITVRANHIEAVRHGAGVIVAQEGSYRTPGPSEIVVDANRILDIQRPPPGGWPAGAPARTGHGAIEIHTWGNRDDDLRNPWVVSHLVVRHVSVTNNQIERPAADGIRIGVGGTPGMVAGVELIGNRISAVGGQPIALLQTGAISRLCGPDDLGTPGCAPGQRPRAGGARLDCSRLR